MSSPDTPLNLGWPGTSIVEIGTGRRDYGRAFVPNALVTLDNKTLQQLYSAGEIRQTGNAPWHPDERGLFEARLTPGTGPYNEQPWGELGDTAIQRIWFTEPGMAGWPESLTPEPSHPKGDMN